MQTNKQETRAKDKIKQNNNKNGKQTHSRNKLNEAAVFLQFICCANKTR